MDTYVKGKIPKIPSSKGNSKWNFLYKMAKSKAQTHLTNDKQLSYKAIYVDTYTFLTLVLEIICLTLFYSASRPDKNKLKIIHTPVSTYPSAYPSGAP